MQRTLRFHRLAALLPAVALLLSAVLCGAPVGAEEVREFGPTPLTRASTTQGGPRITFDKEAHDWGKVIQGDAIEHTFKVFNSGDQPLKILDVKPGCSCTTGGFSKEVPPGGEGYVKLKVKSEKVGTGKPAKKSTEVTCNDPTRPKIKLIMSGQTTKAFEWTPANLALEGMPEEALAGEVTIKASEGVQVSSFELKSKKKSLVLDQVTEVVPNREWHAKISVPAAVGDEVRKSTKENLQIVATILQEQGANKELKLDIPVSVKFKDRIQVSPSETLSFNKKDTISLRGENPTPLVKKLSISTNDPKLSFKVTKVELIDVPEGLFEATLSEVKPGAAYEIAVSLKQYVNQRMVRGKLVFETDDPSLPRREIKLYATFDVGTQKDKAAKSAEGSAGK